MKTIYLFIVGVVAAFVFGMLAQRKFFNPELVPTSDTVVISKTIHDTTFVKVPEPYRVEVPVNVIDSFIVHEIDTHYVFMDYFSSYDYDTTLIKKGVYTANIGYQVHMNKSRNFYANIDVTQKETIIDNTVYIYPTWHLWVGADLQNGFSQFITLDFETKKGFMFGLGLDPFKDYEGQLMYERIQAQAKFRIK